MKTHLIVALAVGLFSCGGSQAGDSNPATPAGTPAAETDDSGPAADTDTNTEAAEPAHDSASTAKGEHRTSDAGEFQVGTADKSSRPTQGKLKATKTEAAVRFFVVDKDKGAIKGIVISLTSPTGKKYYTKETDADGFTEVLLPIGQTYELVYLSLGRKKNIAAKVKVADKPNLNLKLTMRYKREEYPTGDVADIASEPATAPAPAPAPRFVLENVQFPTGKATLTDDSYTQLDGVVEYLTYKESARIEISGHTDNVGNKKRNKKLSQKRADAVRDYLVSKGIDANRIDAVGYGHEKPIASNDTPEGRQKNRRIEATEL